MAAGAAVQSSTWRLMFGDTEGWAPPQVERSAENVQAAQNSALSWRVIFGSTAEWAPPQVGSLAVEPGNAPAERCELCRQPIAPAEEFVANSAGQRLTHARCLGEHPQVTREDEPSRSWWGMLYEFVKS